MRRFVYFAAAFLSVLSCSGATKAQGEILAMMDLRAPLTSLAIVKNSKEENRC